MNITRQSRLLIRCVRLFNVRQTPVISSTIARFRHNDHRHDEDSNNTCSNKNFTSVFSKSPEYSETPLLDLAIFEPACGETLELLTDYFEEIVEEDDKLDNSDVSYSDGVLTVKLGGKYGTYVINRQTPNRQLWLSSPISGPKRYDLINNNWIYKHDGVSLYQLLQNELEKTLSVPVDFMKFEREKK